MSVEDSRVFEMTQIDNKSYYFLFDSLARNVNSVMITPTDSALRYVSSGSIEFPVNQDYYHAATSLTTVPLLQTNDVFSIISDYQIISNRMKYIEEVSVTESRIQAADYVNEYEKEYKNFSMKTLDKGDIEAAFDLLTLIRMLHPIKIIFDPWEPNIFTVYLRRVFYGLENPVLEPALFILDGFPVGTDNRKIYFLRPEEIHSVTALKGPYGYYRYGPKAIGGVIFIETKHNSIGGEYAYEEPLPDRGDLGKVISLFRPNIEFYIPDKMEIADDPQHWTRPTLYWIPELVYDGSNPVSIAFPNHLKKGTVLIRVNGVTVDSRPFFGEYRYKIK